MYPYLHVTIMLLNASDISLGVGAVCFSGAIDTPDEILSSMSFKITGATVSSVALIVKRTICTTC